MSTVKPHHGVSRDTISRWTKVTIKLSGIDTSVFTPHSTRAARTSAAANCARVPLTDILRYAGWSMLKLFFNYYQKHIDSSGSVPCSFSTLLQDASVKNVINS